MKREMQSLNELERSLTIELSENDFNYDLNEYLKTLDVTPIPEELSDYKTTKDALDQLSNKTLREDILQQLFINNFKQTTSELNLCVAGAPDFNLVEMTAGNGVVFTTRFEIYPAITLPDLKTFKFTQLVAEITDKDIDGTISVLQRQQQQWATTQRAAQAGDSVIINYKGQIDDQILSGSAMRVELIETDNDAIQSFENSLTGVKAGDNKEVEIYFPKENYPVEIAGKTVVFDVEVIKVESTVLPEVDKEFIKSHSIADGKIESLRQAINRNMDRHLQQVIRMKNTLNLFSQILKTTPITHLPQILVKQEVKRQLCDPCEEVEGVESFKHEMEAENFTELARKRVTRSLMINKLAEKFDIKPDTKEIRARVKDLIEEYSDKERILDWFYADKERLAGIESDVLGEQVADWIFQHYETEQIETSYSEMMDF